MVWAHKFCREPVQRTAAESGLCSPLVLYYLPEMLHIISANRRGRSPSAAGAELHQLFCCLNKHD